MIIRPEQHWFLRLFDWHGSVLSKIVFRLLLNLMMSIIAIISYQWYEQLGIHLTVAPFSLLGIAIAIFLGFRNSAGYNRFVEARNLWGTVLIAQRTLVRQLKNILPAESAAHQRLVSYLVAFSWSLKHQLRKTDPSADLARLLPAQSVAEILASSMPTNRILLLAGDELGRLRAEGKIGDVTFSLMDNKLDELGHALGGCERLASTPGALCLHAHFAAHRVSVLYAAAVCAGRRFFTI
ncbi:Predicted membrane protein [Klebsiella michiganensis]|nr:Predicted membrane protein [Klebsiella michiganensis]